MEFALSLVRQIKPRLAAALLGFVFLCGVLEVISVWALRSLFMICLGQSIPFTDFLQRLPIGFLVNTRQHLLVTMLVGVFLFITLKNLLLVALWRKALLRLAHEQAAVACRLFERYLHAPYAAHATRSWASLNYNISAASNQLFIRLVFPALLAASELLVLCGILVYLMYRAPIITVLLVLWLGLAAQLFRLLVVKVSRRAGKERNRTAESITRLSHETMSDFRSIKLSAAEDHFVDIFRDNARTLGRHLATDRLMIQLPRFVFEPILIGGLGVLFALLFLTHASHQAVYGALTLYAAAAVRILPAVQRLLAQIHLIAFDRSILTTIAADIAQPVEDFPPCEGGRHHAPFERELRLDGVGLAYPGVAPVLRQLNLTIRPGDKIAVVGTTGVGKTSLVNLLLGFVRPSEGRILYDDDDAPPLAKLRCSAVAYVQQDPFLLDTTVLENIAFAAATDSIDEDRIWDALRRAGIDRMVRQLPNGLNTRVGENGIRFSGGERQRLALARAFYQDPAFLILDEATSQLDTATEQMILDDLFDNHAEITIVMVTHRQAAARHFHRCFRVENRTIAELSPPTVAVGPEGNPQ